MHSAPPSSPPPPGGGLQIPTANPDAPVSPLRLGSGIAGGIISPLLGGAEAAAEPPVSPPRGAAAVSPPREAGRKRAREAEAEEEAPRTWRVKGRLEKIIGGFEVKTEAGEAVCVPPELAAAHPFRRGDAVEGEATQGPPSPGGTRPLPRLLSVLPHTPKAAAR
eukprot:tig00000663_g3009.t1